MEESSLPRLVVRGALHGAALGLMVGGLEALPLGVLVTAPIGVLGTTLLCLSAAASFAAAGFVVAFVLGWPVHFLLKRVVISRGLALQLALTGFLLIGYLFGGFALEEVDGGRPGAALFLAGLPIFLFFAIFLLSSRLYRMDEMGTKPVIGFWPVALGGAALLMAVGIGLSASRDTGGRGALPSDPRLVVIVVDGLRADMGEAKVPNLKRLALAGTTFTQAVTPMPSVGPAVASILTGLPASRHAVVRPDHRLPRARGLLSLTLADAGYAVGGFVSDPALSDRRGFGYGFQTYDALRSAPVAGLERERIWGHLGSALGLFAERRSASATVDRFLGWLGAHSDVPFFAMIQLSDPEFSANPADGIEGRELVRAYQARVEEVDAQIGRVLDALEAHGLTDTTLVAVVGSSGVSLGDDGVYGPRGLSDSSVLVPMIVRVPGAAEGAVITPQVRLQDLYPTLLEHCEVAPRHQAEALALQGLASGTRERGLAATLVGRASDGAWLIGVRSGGFKYVRDVGRGDESLFDLDEDPKEVRDLSEQRPDALEEERRKASAEGRRLANIFGISLAPTR